MLQYHALLASCTSHMADTAGREIDFKTRLGLFRLSPLSLSETFTGFFHRSVNPSWRPLCHLLCKLMLPSFLVDNPRHFLTGQQDSEIGEIMFVTIIYTSIIHCSMIIANCRADLLECCLFRAALVAALRSKCTNGNVLFTTVTTPL